MIKVMIVDDSKTTREYLKHVIASDPTLYLAAEAQNGSEAVLKVAKYRPDVVIMDIQMPEMDGYDATREIMETTPVPIVIHSTLVAPEQSDNIFAALQAGAVAVAEKPPGIGHPDSDTLTRKLIRTVKLMSEVKVVKRKKQLGKLITPPGEKSTFSQAVVVGIGASTGGPPVLQSILSSLPEGFPAPILIVQHISKGFLGGMIHWLSRDSQLILKVPRSGEAARPGHVYFAPEETHMGITAGGNIMLSPVDPAARINRPINYLFQSLAKNFKKNALGILLTGMGNDGAAGLKGMKQNGARTLAQDRESSVIFGMPSEAIKLDAVDFVLSPRDIIEYLMIISRNHTKMNEPSPVTD